MKNEEQTMSFQEPLSDYARPPRSTKTEDKMKTEIEGDKIQKIQEISNQLVAQAKRAIVNSDETLGKSADLRKMITVQINNLEVLRKKEYVGPLNAVVKRLNGDFKKITGPLQKAADWLSNENDRYLEEREENARKAREQAARETEERAIKEAEALQAAGRAAEADEIMSQGASVASAVTAAHAAPVRGDYGAVVSVRREWTFELEDIAEVPARYLVINAQEIRSDILTKVKVYREEAAGRGLSGDVAEAFLQEAMGNFKIPGLRIHQKVSSMVR